MCWLERRERALVLRRFLYEEDRSTNLYLAGTIDDPIVRTRDKGHSLDNHTHYEQMCGVALRKKSKKERKLFGG